MTKPRASTSFSQYSSGIIVPLLVLIAGLAAYFLLLPKFKDARSEARVLQAKEAETEKRKLALQDIQFLTAELGKKQSQLESVNEALPTAPRIPELLANLEELTKRSGVLITGMQVIPAPTAATVAAGLEVTRIKRTQEILSQTEGLTVMQIDLSLKGKYPNILSLLKNIEQNLRLLDVQMLVLDQVDIESQTQEFSLQLQTYYQKDDK